jgi:hypothetical protein
LDGDIRNDFGNNKHDRSLSASAFSPLSIYAEETFIIQVFIHEAGFADEVKKLALSADVDTAKRFQSTLNIDPDEPRALDVSLISEDLELDESKYSLQWCGGVASVQFLATVPKTCTKANVFCTIVISVESVPIGCMKFKIKVTAHAAKKPVEKETLNNAYFQKFKKVFISYATEDRVEVLKRVQMINSLKIDFFQDVLSLEPGDEWERKLYDQISKSDAFFLFWSSAAARSSWVRKEIIYVLSVKSGREDNLPYIIPIIIEGPPPPAPPAELSFLNFNDKLLYLINR